MSKEDFWFKVKQASIRHPDRMRREKIICNAKKNS